MNFVFGSSGYAKEVDWLISDLPNQPLSYLPDFFVSQDNIGEFLNGVRIISEDEFHQITQPNPEFHQIIIAISKPYIREKIHNQLLNFEGFQFPTLIHPSVLMDKREGKITFGKGVLISGGSILETDIDIQDFVQINMGASIGHDTVIHKHSTISPGARISGNVVIGNRVFIGAGAVVLEKISICDDVVIGAGAVITKAIKEPGTYVGVPGKKVVKNGK
jgi:sugar O-acyltransferase (sialic acid O-acetyltransferase NeuD family)